MKYRKEKANHMNVQLGTYPVYVEDMYYGHEPFKVTGITEDKLQLEGDYSAMYNVLQKDWIDIKRCFVVVSVCEQQLQPYGCQIHNVNCCGGGSQITEHVNKYWDHLIK